MPWHPAHPPVHLASADGIALGLHNPLTGECVMNPPLERRLQKGDEVVLLHPGRQAVNRTERSARAGCYAAWQFRRVA